MNEGKVNSIYFDPTSRNILYDVTSQCHSRPILMPAKELAYAPSCPVFVSSALSESGSESAHEMLSKGGNLIKGTVLLSKKRHSENNFIGDNTWMYMVTIEHANVMRIVQNIPSCNVTYRF